MSIIYNRGVTIRLTKHELTALDKIINILQQHLITDDVIGINTTLGHYKHLYYLGVRYISLTPLSDQDIGYKNMQVISLLRPLKYKPTNVLDVIQL